MKWSKIILIVLLLVCTAKAVHYYKKPSLDDFKVYMTAATLVQEHHSLLIYNGADTGIDPQLRWADPSSIFARTAANMGIGKVRMYLYPPVLADGLVPLSYLSFRAAGALWTVINVLVLVMVGWICVRLLQIPSALLPMGALVLGIATFFPALSCLDWGQVIIVLLGLWTFGVYGYARGWIVASAFALALATSIKLTPLLAIVPFFLWKEWRWLRAYFISLAGIFAATWLVNGSACLEDFVARVMPSMSNGNPDAGNRSIINCLQYFYVMAKHLPVGNFSPAVGLAGKLLSLLLIVASATFVWRSQRLMDLPRRIVVLSIFSLLSVLVSPVSWQHAFTMGLLTFLVLWAEALRQRVPPVYLALLAITSLELNGFKISYMLRNGAHGLRFAAYTSIPVVLGIALVLYRLAAMRTFAALESDSLQARPEIAAAA